MTNEEKMKAWQAQRRAKGLPDNLTGIQFSAPVRSYPLLRAADRVGTRMSAADRELRRESLETVRRAMKLVNEGR
jgi:hypothetical protein